MNFHVREMVEGDFVHVRALLENVGLMEKGELTQKKFRKMMLRNQGCCFVGQAQETDRIVGSVFGTHDGAIFGHIYKLAVAEDFQRNGLGKQLVSHVLAAFKKLEFDTCFAHVHRDNRYSILLFESFGFNAKETHHFSLKL